VLSLSVGIVLLGAKFLAYILTGSAAIFSDAMESIVNVVASVVAVYSLALAHRPADAEHPYGHGKAEFLSASFEGGMILLAGIVILGKAIMQLLGPDLKLEKLGMGLLLMAAAMAVNGGLGMFLVFTGRRHKSMALEADGQHLLSDAVTSVAALVAVGLVKLAGWTHADPVGAIFIAFYIGIMGLRVLKPATAGLMDKQDAQDEAMLQGILDAHLGKDGREPRICSYHKLRHRHSGRYHWVDFHIRVPPEMDVARAHALASAIEGEIERALGEGDATAHVEPCSDRPCSLAKS